MFGGGRLAGAITVYLMDVYLGLLQFQRFFQLLVKNDRQWHMALWKRVILKNRSFLYHVVTPPGFLALRVGF